MVGIDARLCGSTPLFLVAENSSLKKDAERATPAQSSLGKRLRIGHDVWWIRGRRRFKQGFKQISRWRHVEK